MDYKCLILLLCLSGAAAQTITVFPENPVGGIVGESVLLKCGIANRGTETMSWSRVDLVEEGNVDIYNSKTDSAIAGYSIQKKTEGGVEYFNLQINSAERALAGFYTCKCLPDSAEQAVLIFDPPAFMDDSDDLVAGIDTTFTCAVTYASPGSEIPFTVQMEDGMGNMLPEYNTTDTSAAVGLDETQTQQVRTVYSNPVVLDWEDDGQDYACVIRIDGSYESNQTLTLDVKHKADNVSLVPYDPEMIYYRGEKVTVLFSANPDPKQYLWYRLVSEVWELVDSEEDNDATITIHSSWPSSTTLKVEIINDYDHDGDGSVTDQVANHTFPMTLRDCCRGSDASKLPYSVLITTLLALLATFFLER